MPTFQLTPGQINFLTIGVGTAVTVYLLYKVLQWFLRRRATTVRRRPRTRQRSKQSTSAAKAPLATSVVRSETTETQKTEPVLETAGVSSEVGSSSSSMLEGFWSVERKTGRKKHPFEDDGIEYPYATPDDLRYGGLTPVLAEMLPSSEEGRRESRRLLRNAGYFEPHAWENFAAGRYLGIFAPMILIGMLIVLAPERFEPYLVGALIIVPSLGWALPALFLRSRAAERLRQIENAMPDMLDLLNMCVSQGMTVINALSRISREFAPVYPALSKELRIVAEQARVGTLAQALNNFSDRVDVPEVHSFTSLLIQTEQMGTSVSEALTDYSDGMRETQRQRADEKANAATFKLLFPTVLCLMPAVFLLLMGPALIELNRFFSRGGVEQLNEQSSQFFNRQPEG